MMNKIIWDSIYKIGDKTIDSHHKHLADIINKLKDNISADPLTVNGEFHKILNELFEYTKYYFAYEEKMFCSNDFEYAEEHIDQHMKFIEAVADMAVKTEHNFANKEELHKFLVDWWKHHILVEDRKYISIIPKNTR